MTEWKEYKLGEITIEGKGSYGIAAPAVDFDINKYTYLRITDINDDGTINKNSLKSVDDINASNYLLKPNDIVFARTGASVGRSYFYDGKDGALVYAGFLIKFSLNPDKVNPKILKYYTHSQSYYDWIVSVDNGATRGNINAQTYASMPIILPERKRQDEIVSILSSLDDKIDLLHRENKTLEAMAETLFRQWFIEEAKEDWEENPLGKCIKLVGGGTPKTSEERFWNGNVFWLSGGDIANNHKSFVSSSEKSISEDGLNNSSAKLLPENAMVISARGTVGKYCLLSKPMAFSQSNYGILPIYNDCYFFTYLLVAYHIDELQSAAYGSVFDTITTKTFEGVSVLIPKETSYIVEFEKMIEPYFSKMKQNNKQIQTLIQQRDSLLPKLMSGEVKI